MEKGVSPFWRGSATLTKQLSQQPVHCAPRLCDTKRTAAQMPWNLFSNCTPGAFETGIIGNICVRLPCFIRANAASEVFLCVLDGFALQCLLFFYNNMIPGGEVWVAIPSNSSVCLSWKTSPVPVSLFVPVENSSGVFFHFYYFRKFCYDSPQMSNCRLLHFLHCCWPAIELHFFTFDNGDRLAVL